ncbi:MAG: hypothetical protein P8Z42_02050 [Anaerolineales bacterium]|jgi:hypothetical protein
MTEIYRSTLLHLRLAFWRVIASVLGWIIRCKSGECDPFAIASYLVAGFGSYFAGKAFAGMILRALLS